MAFQLIKLLDPAAIVTYFYRFKTTAPASPSIGDAWLDQENNRIAIYTNSGWKYINLI
jgi:hypothetical protein